MPEQEQQIQPRQTAYKISIKNITNGTYIQQEGWQPNYIQVIDKHVSRVNLIATVIDKQIFENLITITLDDGTGNIQAKTFNEDTKKLKNINIGDFLLIIGRPRKYNEQLFITVEIAKKIDPIWGRVRRLELELGKNKEGTQQIIEESVEEDENEKILSLIKKLDTGQGSEISEVLKISNLDEQQAQDIINELLKQGEIYENKPGYLKNID